MFKGLFKNKIFIGCSAAVIAVGIFTTILLLPRKQQEKEALKVNTSSITTNISDIATPSEPESAVQSNQSAEKETVSNLVVDVTGNPSSQPSTSSNKAKEPAKPVTPVKPKEDNSSGIQIGGGEEKPAPYKCGVKNHKCNGPETHAFILNLELEGCPTCGSHSCPSFYGTDEWGNGGLFPKLCPKYNEKNDPLLYCQDCGKKTGDGHNGTCAQFVKDADCPNCGVFVKANTCHTCK